MLFLDLTVSALYTENDLLHCLLHALCFLSFFMKLLSNFSAMVCVKVLFDAPLDIEGVGDKEEVLAVFFNKLTRKWFVRSKDGVIHLYDGYDNGGTNVTSNLKVGRM